MLIIDKGRKIVTTALYKLLSHKKKKKRINFDKHKLIINKYHFFSKERKANKYVQAIIFSSSKRNTQSVCHILHQANTNTEEY